MLWLWPLQLLAHPHVFIENQATFLFDDKGLAGIRLKWVFDDMFGASFIMDYDMNGNGNFEPAEARLLKAEAFDNLINFGYFSNLRIDGKPFPVKFIEDFKPTIENGALCYTFTIPCHVSAAARSKVIQLAVFDVEYYSQIDCLAPKVDSNRFSTSIKSAKNQQLSYYNGLMVPADATLTMQLKP